MPEREPERGGRAVFTFATTHEAMTAEDVLREAGVPLEVVPPPRGLSAGCGLALRIALDIVPAALETLRAAGARFEALHRLADDQSVLERLH